MRLAAQITLTDEERAELDLLVRDACTSAQLLKRAQMVLLAAEGMQNKEIAARLGVGRVQVSRWRERFAEARLAGIEHNLPRGAPPRKVDVMRLAGLAEQAEPATGRPWSVRKMASELGVSPSSVARHWRALGRKRQAGREPFRPSSLDPALPPGEVAGLYLSAGEHAIAYLVEDAGSRNTGKAIIAEAAAQSEDQFEGPSANLLAALGSIVQQSQGVPGRPLRHAEWSAFLRRLERDVPPRSTIHLFADNPATNNHVGIQRWLAEHPQITVRLAPTPESWLQAVRHLLRGMVPLRPRRGQSGVAQPMLEALSFYRAEHGSEPFVWVAVRASAQGPEEGLPADRSPAPDAAVNSRHGDTGGGAPRTAWRDRIDVQGASPGGHGTLPHIARSKLAPPRVGPHQLQRDALPASLRDARRQRCVVVTGPAGSGKTSALLACRRIFLSLEFDVAWLSVAPEDNEPRRFLECLLASIAEVDAGLPTEAISLNGQGSGEESVEHLVITLVRAISRRPRELVLMIDDVHHLADARIVQALQWLLDYAPSNLHFAFGSRSVLRLSLERIRSQQGLAEITMQQLRLSVDETARMLSEQLGPLGKGDVKALYELTEGWVTGVQLISAALRANQGGESYSLEAAGDAQILADYFDREVIRNLSADDVGMLTRLAVCERVCSSLGACLLGMPEAASRTAERLTRLEAGHQFLARTAGLGSETWYQLHPLLRRVLLRRVASLSAAEQGALHAAAWSWFAARGDIEAAVHHAVQAGDVEAAAGMVESCAYELLTAGKISQMSRLLRLLPTEQVQSRFELSLATASLQLYTNKFEALEQSLQRMSTSYPALLPRQRHSLSVLRAGLALQQDNPDAVSAMLPELQEMLDEADDFARSVRGNVLAWALIDRAEYDSARAILDEVGRYGGTARSNLLNRCIGAMSLMSEGHIKAAEGIAREALREADALGPGQAGLACMAAGLLAETLYEANDVEAACALLEPRIGALQRASLPDMLLRAFVVLAKSHWASGRRAQAHACLNRLEAHAFRHGLDRLHVTALAMRMRDHIEQQEVDQAKTLLDRIEALASPYLGMGGTTASRVRLVAERARVDMRLCTQDFAGAARSLEVLIETAHKHGQRHEIAQLQLCLAIAQHALGRKEAAHSSFLQALRCGHRLGLMRAMLDVSRDVPAVLTDLLKEEVLDPVLAFYVQRLLAASQAPETGVAAQHIKQDELESMLSEREREILDLVAQTMSNKKIALVLSLSPDTVKWHLKSIYAKLGVASRSQAAARLRERQESQSTGMSR